MIMTLELPFSAACERNKQVILDQIKLYLRNTNEVFEIGSGTAQHAVHFSSSLPHLTWQTSDCSDYIAGIHAQIKAAKNDNVLEPVVLDVDQPQWLSRVKKYSAVYTANTLHIMPWRSVENFFKGLPQITDSGSLLFIYGPFKYDGKFTSPSNAEFDQSLRLRGKGSAIRDFEKIKQCALKSEFRLLEDISMPANNQLLIWRRT